MFDPEKFVEEKTIELKNKIEDKSILACSGGVDSTVAAVLTAKAIDNRLIAVYVDTGFMRKNESEEVKKILEDLNVNFKLVNASQEFYEALKGIISIIILCALKPLALAGECPLFEYF